MLVWLLVKKTGIILEFLRNNDITEKELECFFRLPELGIEAKTLNRLL